MAAKEADPGDRTARSPIPVNGTRPSLPAVRFSYVVAA